MKNTSIIIPLLAIVQPLVILFTIKIFLFDNNAAQEFATLLNKTYWNLGFGTIVFFLLCALYNFLYTAEYIICTIVTYMTIFSWILLNSANFDFPLHKSVWMTIYAMTVIIESLLWVFLYIK